ncbi:hypothetical protein Pa4123_88020 [Phytohabitans aurantiacus]|uniref:SnoaL-like domain-containing protein n=2 Tax=Phytohabitans aurantiacus TaxID=3016789 RepID=A0ABQ5R9U7_9ACTN|nr:hypothetical protein Pa4123_88020 [Phytohabitans aurantiacus]
MMVGGLVALLCLGGAGVVFVAYREATEPDRSAPDVAVDNYLRAYLVDRNQVRAEQYVCGQPSLESVAALRSEIDRREKDFNVSVQLTWGSLSVSEAGDQARLVRTDLTVASFADGQARARRVETWEFRTVDESGWRVCSAAKV